MATPFAIATGDPQAVKIWSPALFTAAKNPKETPLVRIAALHVLSRHAKENTQTLPLLLDIAKNTDNSAALREGMTAMVDDATAKCRAGVTSAADGLPLVERSTSRARRPFSLRRSRMKRSSSPLVSSVPATRTTGSTEAARGVMAAVALLICTMAIMNGFRSDLLSRIVGFQDHIYIQGPAIENASREALLARLRKIPGVRDVQRLQKI